ncbi:MAG: guanosine-3',5'-bis(diphosphate) 3'-pyrophosphohydrolase [Desulfobulbaceae bacterium A2]|nr:MAG: guanosine-3',5'-bis(diphosphate) 3'-pyrophosphohydrolase [Desulfobulbaceae bacterium A2]
MLLEHAIQRAAQAHSGQKDKGGSPYILHPLRVMLRMESEDERIVAVLHDVVEDSKVTFEMLSVAGFSETILDALRALTKQPGETRIVAAERAAKNRLACRVKLADNAENMDMSRIPEPTAKDLARLEEYKAVRAILEAAL